MVRTKIGIVAGFLAGLSLSGAPRALAQPTQAEAEDPGTAAGGPAAAPQHGHLGVLLGGKREIRVLEVAEGSAAARAGIEEGDVIIEVDGQAVRTSADVSAAIQALHPGDPVHLKLRREGRELELSATLGEPKAGSRGPHGGEGWSKHDWGKEWSRHWGGHWGGSSPRVRIGVDLQGLSEGLRGYFHVPAGEGVLVAEVHEDSPASRAGLEAGDVLIAVADQPVRSRGDVLAALAGVEPGSRVPVRLIRKGAERTIEVMVAERPAIEGHWWRGGIQELSPEIRDTIREAIADVRDDLAEAREELRRTLDSSREQIRLQMEQLRKQLQSVRAELRAV